ncbi:MAG: hypothetical protein MJY89_06440 [Bacteroidales bacterium]|nr:hypothetical protein [Bacteroidales bacterium]
MESKIEEALKLGLDSIFLKVESESDKNVLEYYSVLFSSCDLWEKSRKVHKCVLKKDTMFLFRVLGKKKDA